MKLAGISMVMLGCSDLDRSARFYRDVLGLDFRGQHGGLAFFGAGSISLVLSADLARATDRLSGAVEVVFQVEHVRLAHRELSTREVLFVNEPRVVSGESWAVTMKDPDGHLLTLFGPE